MTPHWPKQTIIYEYGKEELWLSILERKDFYVGADLWPIYVQIETYYVYSQDQYDYFIQKISPLYFKQLNGNQCQKKTIYKKLTAIH